MVWESRKLSTAWRMTASTANSVSGEQKTDLVAQRVVEDRAVLLLDERVDRLVRDEEQDAVDGVRRRVVVAARDFLQPEADVAQELLAPPLPLDVGSGLVEPQVVVERELHVHVQGLALRQQERVVGDAARSRDGLVAAVVDAVDEAGEAEHVFGHALPPLPARGGARERLAQ